MLTKWKISQASFNAAVPLCKTVHQLELNIAAVCITVLALVHAGWEVKCALAFKLRSLQYVYLFRQHCRDGQATHRKVMV
jgi:hypothetical protein